VTPVANFNGNPALVDNPCGSGCFHGFVPSATKTDNFKVNTAAATFCLTVQKQMLQSDGKTVLPQPNWEFDVTDPLLVTNKFFTDTTGQLVVCDLAPGTYVVAEDPTSSVMSITANANVTLTPLVPPIATSTSFTWMIGQPAVGIVFVNQVPQVVIQ
jgi:hypothetical protein